MVVGKFPRDDIDLWSMRGEGKTTSTQVLHLATKGRRSSVTISPPEMSVHLGESFSHSSSYLGIGIPSAVLIAGQRICVPVVHTDVDVSSSELPERVFQGIVYVRHDRSHFDADVQVRGTRGRAFLPKCCDSRVQQ